MKIFVTGGTGFIGSHFLNQCSYSQFEITALKRENSEPRIPILNPSITWLQGDISEIDESKLKGFDAVVHLAAHSANYPYDSLLRCIDGNLIKPLKFFQSAYDAGIRYFLATGTCFEYGLSGSRYDNIPVDAPLEPIGPYATSKALSSLAFREFANQENSVFQYLRIFQVYGEGEQKDRFWPSLIMAAKSGENFQMSHGNQVRDFIHVDKVVLKIIECLLNFTEVTKGFNVQNVGTGVATDLKSFAQSWWGELNAKGVLQIGAIPSRSTDIGRLVAEI